MKALWIVLGAYTATWGAWVLSPFWSVFERAPLYTEMQEFIPEWAWGLHAVAVGVSILYGMIYQWPRGLWWGYISSLYHWGLISIFYAWGDWKSTGTLTSLFVVALVIIMWQLTPRTPKVYPLDK